MVKIGMHEDIVKTYRLDGENRVLTREDLVSMIKEEKETSRLYRALGWNELADDEEKHAEFLIKVLKETFTEYTSDTASKMYRRDI